MKIVNKFFVILLVAGLFSSTVLYSDWDRDERGEYGDDRYENHDRDDDRYEHGREYRNNNDYNRSYERKKARDIKNYIKNYK